MSYCKSISGAQLYECTYSSGFPFLLRLNYSRDGAGSVPYSSKKHAFPRWQIRSETGNAVCAHLQFEIHTHHLLITKRWFSGTTNFNTKTCKSISTARNPACKFSLSRSGNWKIIIFAPRYYHRYILLFIKLKTIMYLTPSIVYLCIFESRTCNCTFYEKDIHFMMWNQSSSRWRSYTTLQHLRKTLKLLYAEPLYEMDVFFMKWPLDSTTYIIIILCAFFIFFLFFEWQT